MDRELDHEINEALALVAWQAVGVDHRPSLARCAANEGVTAVGVKGEMAAGRQPDPVEGLA